MFINASQSVNYSEYGRFQFSVPLRVHSVGTSRCQSWLGAFLSPQKYVIIPHIGIHSLA